MKLFAAFILCMVQTLCFATAINPNLTASYHAGKKQVDLKWQNTDSRVIRFVLQRSADNKTWKEIYSVSQEAFSKKKQEKFYDRSPETAKNYYRLQVFTAENNEYTASIMVIIGSTVNNWIMYPVPVRDILNLQYTGSEAISGVVSVFIQNMYGYVLTKKRYNSLNRIIQVPVENLGRGTYDVRIVINEEVVWNQRFLK